MSLQYKQKQNSLSYDISNNRNNRFCSYPHKQQEENHTKTGQWHATVDFQQQQQQFLSLAFYQTPRHQQNTTLSVIKSIHSHKIQKYP